MARRGCLTYDNAVTLMNEEIDLMRHQIEAHGEYAVGRLGALHRNTEGTLIFEPFASTLISPRLCGLKPVKATPIAIEKPESLTTENVIASAENSRLSFKGVFKIAASIILLVGLGITISTPVIENAPDFAGIATTRTAPKTEPLFVNDINPDIQLTIALPDPETASATVEKKVTEYIYPPETPMPKLKHLLPAPNMPPLTLTHGFAVGTNSITQYPTRV